MACQDLDSCRVEFISGGMPRAVGDGSRMVVRKPSWLLCIKYRNQKRRKICHNPYSLTECTLDYFRYTFFVTNHWCMSIWLNQLPVVVTNLWSVSELDPLFLTYIGSLISCFCRPRSEAMMNFCHFNSTLDIELIVLVVQ